MTSEVRSSSPTQDTRQRSDSLDQKMSSLEINSIENSSNQRSQSPNNSISEVGGIVNPLQNQEKTQGVSPRI